MAKVNASFDDASLRYDPNASMPAGLIALAVSAVSDILAEGRPQATTSGSVLEFRIGYRRLLVYVRVTQEKVKREGTGNLPGLVRKLAQKLDAEPHVVRVNITPASGGLAYLYWGQYEVQDAFRRSPDDWSAHLMGGERFWRTCKRASRPLSVLNVVPMFYRTDLDEKSTTNPERVAEPGSVPNGNEKLSLTLWIDGIQFQELTTACPLALAASVHGSDEQYIFTCGCGVPGCAGIEEGVLVLHNGDRVVWVVNSLPDAPVFVFDRVQYCSEIRAKLGMAIKIGMATKLPSNMQEWIPYGVTSRALSEMLEYGRLKQP